MMWRSITLYTLSRSLAADGNCTGGILCTCSLCFAYRSDQSSAGRVDSRAWARWIHSSLQVRKDIIFARGLFPAGGRILGTQLRPGDIHWVVLLNHPNLEHPG